MKTNENQKSTNSQPATQKPFFGAKPEQAFFSLAKEQSTPFFQRSATSDADAISESVVQRMPAFESEVKDNGAVQRKFVNPSPIQAKLTIGEPGDKYEQEADRVASQVVEQINAPAPVQSNQGQSVQRQEEKKEELQAKPDITSLQRQEEKPEELQAKFTIQRREDIAGGEASPDLTSAINSARGGGQPLDASLQKSMGQAMGADFSGVRVHTDTQSDQLNRSIQAKAFTTGQDVFFRQGAYEPGSRGGQELIAHELTHVVQQNGGAVMRLPLVEARNSTVIQRLIEQNTSHWNQGAAAGPDIHAHAAAYNIPNLGADLNNRAINQGLASDTKIVVSYPRAGAPYLSHIVIVAFWHQGVMPAQNRIRYHTAYYHRGHAQQGVPNTHYWQNAAVVNV
ncbi:MULTISPECIES: eCIS core domain-containing protein [Calothrix]|uniref:eCIS core domain-containing protein n=1 Tax=Calothrix TaxID=1186 RepID=UPI0018EF5F71|nr:MULTISPECIES: DUF4157 domain-containing protein [Calothrix]